MSDDEMRIVILTTDNREHYRRYNLTRPYFGAAPEALLQGFATVPRLEVHVLSCTQQPMTSPEKLAPNIWFHSLHVAKVGWLRTGYQGCIRAVRAKLRQLQPDIVHGQGTERDCAISAAFSGWPAVITIHGNMTQLARMFHAPIGSYPWWAARLETLALARARGVLCNSVYTEQLVRPRARRTWLVPNPVRQEFFAPVRKPSSLLSLPILCCVAAIVPRKRPLELARLAQGLSQDGHRFELRFIGRIQADDFDSLKAAIARWLTAGAPRLTLAAAVMLRYKPEKIAARHVEIYREVLNTSS